MKSVQTSMKGSGEAISDSVGADVEIAEISQKFAVVGFTARLCGEQGKY